MREIRSLVEKAEKFLDTAKHVFDGGDYDSAVSRCYYAMFFMAEAVLLTKALQASSHKGVLSLFGEHFVKTGIFERGLGRALNDAYDERLLGDYGVGNTVTEEDARELLSIAQDFVQQLKKYLQPWLA